MILPAPSPSPPALKTIVNEVVHPFCTALRGRVGAAVVMQGRNNQILVQTFPQLDKYNRGLIQGSDSDAYFAARKLDALDRQLTQNLKQIQSLIVDAVSPASSASPQPNDTRLVVLHDNLVQVYQQQLAAQQALDRFVGEALYSAAPEGRSIMAAAKADNTASAAAAARSGSDASYTQSYAQSHAAPVAAVSMPELPKILDQSLQNVNAAEEKIRPIVQQGVDECFNRH